MERTNHRVERIRGTRRTVHLATAAMFVAALWLGGCNKEEKKPVAMVPVVETAGVVQRDVPVKKESDYH